MSFPDFFEHIPVLTLRDALAGTLGAPADGIIEYRYADAVRLAGHSCPTVAGAWLIACRALAALYPDTLPQRGELRIDLRAQFDVGTSGVVGSVLGLLTGAAGDGGFKGLGARHSRRDLLRYGVGIGADVRIARMDTGASVLIDYHPEVVAPSPDLPALMARVVGGVADAQESALFTQLWQDRVRRILLQHADDPTLVVLRAA